MKFAFCEVCLHLHHRLPSEAKPSEGEEEIYLFASLRESLVLDGLKLKV